MKHKKNIFECYNSDCINFIITQKEDITHLYKSISDNIEKAIYIKCEEMNNYYKLLVENKYENFYIFSYNDGSMGLMNLSYSEDILCELSITEEHLTIEKINSRVIKKII